MYVDLVRCVRYLDKVRNQGAKFIREYVFPDGESVAAADAGSTAVDVGVAKN